MIKTILVLASTFFVIHATNYCLREKELNDDQFFDEVHGYFNGRKPQRTVAIECPDPKDNSTCLYIVDRLGYFKDGSWFVARFLTPVPSLTKGFLSMSKLAKPIFKTKRTADTAIWPVDVGTMDVLTPNAVEFATLFTSGHFPINHNFTANFTFLGVATGGLMSFLNEHFKNIKITGIDIDPQSEYLAKKWFGYHDRDNSKILIGDGAEFIIEMAERGETSNAVLIDACHNIEPADGIFCPVEAARTPQFLDSLSKVISLKGMTTFNVYNHHAKPDSYKRVLSDFSKHFVECKLIENYIGNVFITCFNEKQRNYEVDTEKTREFLTKTRVVSFMVS
ncbi:unnamed protein product [Caenorhabditis brenneri]